MLTIKLTGQGSLTPKPLQQLILTRKLMLTEKNVIQYWYAALCGVFVVLLRLFGMSRRFYFEVIMETRVALIGIVVENQDSVEKLNSLLHEYGRFIIGRMGVPYEKKKVSIISVAIDAPNDVISSLSGKLGSLDGITTKTVYSKI